MSPPAPSSEQRNRLGRIVAGVRPMLAIAMGVLVWVAAIGAGTAGFSAQVTTEPWDILREEVLGFAVAFTVAGTITGLAASATSGPRRWTIAFGAISLVLLAASVAILRWWIFRSTAPNVGWGQSVWSSAVGSMEAGFMLGAITGLVITGLVLVAAVVERHTARWQFGLIVAVAVAGLGLGVLPAVMSHLSDLIVLYSGPHYRYLYDKLISGAPIGAGTGGLVGAVVVGMIARLFAAAEQRIGRQPGESAP
jgi:glucan phosphoethanolaminetransferase (alkaline phosphatase superfamily)